MIGMNKRRTSELWRFFTEVDTQYAVCNLCKLKLSHRTTTSNLQKHLKTRHPTITCSTRAGTRGLTRGKSTDIEIISTESQPSTSSEQIKKTTQNSSTNLQQMGSTKLREPRVESVLPARIPATSKDIIDRKLLSLFICDLQPISIVEDEGFKEYTYALNPDYQLPSRSSISNTALPALYDECLNNTRGLISSGKTFCITTDTWTSIHAVSFIGVTAHFLDDNFNLYSVLLECSSCHLSDTENLATELRRVTQEWGIYNKIIFAVSDNDAKIQEAIRDVGWENTGCLADTINLLVKDGLEDECTQEIIEKIREIVKHFRRSKVTSSDKLYKYRENLETNPLKLILDVPSRWNSTFYMLERFIHLEEAVKSTVAGIEKELPVLTAAEWETVKELCHILNPFEEALRALSGEKYCASSFVIPICKGLRSILEKLSQNQLPEPLMNVVRRLRLGFEERLGNVENIRTLGVNTFLDPKFKQLGFSTPSIAENIKNDIVKMIAERIMKETPERQNTVKRSKSVEENEDENSSIWGFFDKIVAASQPEETSYSRATIEMYRYVEKDFLPRQQNSFLWWQEQKEMLPYLSKIAQETLCTSATSVPCERLFSKAGQVLLERRNRLSNRKTQMILFLNANMQYLRND